MRWQKPTGRNIMAAPRPLFSTALIAGAVLVSLSACGPAEEVKTEPIRPVRVIAVEENAGGQTVSLTGQIQAEEEAKLSFRVGGRMIERLVNVGDRVSAGQVVARLEEEPARNALQTARANLAAATGELSKTRADYGRQRELLAGGWTTRVRYDQALQALRVAQSGVDSAQAQLATAEDNLDYTQLFADASGSVTARGAEPGEVVTAGQMIVRVAREGGRDAVFDVPERIKSTAPANPEVRVALASDPQVRAVGRIREVSPQADPVTRTFEVRVGLEDPPPAMRLGSTVVGTIEMTAGSGMVIPGSALHRVDGQAAVWVVDPESSTVSLRPIEVDQFNLASVEVARGLASGEVVVTAGVQALRPGQQVRLLGAAGQ